MESPPPTKEKAPFLVTDATAFATSFVPVEKFLRDSKLCTIGEGTSEIQKLVISRKILSK